MDALPLYEMRISEDTNSELEVTAIALVDNPAIEKDWFAFKENVSPMNFTTIDEDEHLLVGPAMIPDMKIYRNSPELGEYNVVFSKETVAQIAEKYYAKSFHGNANIMHDAGQQVTGVNYFLSFIKDTKKGMVGLAGEYPEGTWFVGARVKNPDVWAKVKAGEIKGFSVEGIFAYAPSSAFAKEKTDAENMLEQIKNILNGMN